MREKRSQLHDPKSSPSLKRRRQQTEPCPSQSTPNQLSTSDLMGDLAIIFGWCTMSSASLFISPDDNVSLKVPASSTVPALSTVPASSIVPASTAVLSPPSKIPDDSEEPTRLTGRDVKCYRCRKMVKHTTYEAQQAEERFRAGHDLPDVRRCSGCGTPKQSHNKKPLPSSPTPEAEPANSSSHTGTPALPQMQPSTSSTAILPNRRWHHNGMPSEHPRLKKWIQALNNSWNKKIDDQMHRKREEKRKKQAAIRQQLKDKYGMSWTWDDDDDDIDDNTSYSEDSEWDDL